MARITHVSSSGNSTNPTFNTARSELSSWFWSASCLVNADCVIFAFTTSSPPSTKRVSTSCSVNAPPRHIHLLMLDSSYARRVGHRFYILDGKRRSKVLDHLRRTHTHMPR